MSAVAVFQASHAEHLREALRAHDAGLPVFLGNPHWAGAERRNSSACSVVSVGKPGQGAISP
jgi:hypothetical protein